MLTPEDLDALIARCQRGTLIARVPEEIAATATTAGLTPTIDAAPAPGVLPYVAPRPGCLYLARPGGKATSPQPWAVVLDVTRLDPAAFVVDEEAYFREVLWGSSDPYEPRMPPDGELPAAVVSRIGCNASLDNGRPTTGEWINSIADELDVSAQVLRCFEAIDSVAYAAPVAPEAVVTTFDLRADPGLWDAPPY
ncbi:hypothetical protein [Patulibacter minatonensis]|uniref:hypothetical protein n=1 Tax=Patulibacter minatonensis TaxID=298163 RepID=UPI00047E52AB|nr:hypothetical protein [Patulibacter minatonensis]